jgi:uncharacterized membrane protein YfcA
MPENTQSEIKETNINDDLSLLEEKTQIEQTTNKTPIKTNTQEKKWKRIANWSLVVLALLFITFGVLAYVPADTVIAYLQTVPGKIDEQFLWMLAIGFAAQMVDGALGMGYGVISTTLLLSGGVNPVVVSGSIHTAEMFSSGASGYSHYKFGNVNKKLFKTLLIPGVIGAICGALLLGFFGEKYAGWLRPIISVYTLLLGIRILINAFKKNIKSQKVKRAGWLAGAGGFLDSFGGGGWGPLVTSTLISKGRSPKYVIGSVSLTEFFVTFSSAVTFFLILGVSHIDTVLGLIIGGLIAAPLAARLVGKLPIKKMFLGVGIIVIISSIRIIWNSIF